MNPKRAKFLAEKAAKEQQEATKTEGKTLKIVKNEAEAPPKAAKEAKAAKPAKEAKAEKPAKAAKPAKEAKARKPRAKRASGSLKTIAALLAHREHEAEVDEDGFPVPSRVFDTKARAAHVLEAAAFGPRENGSVRAIPHMELVRHLNATLFAKVFGVALRPKAARMLVDGLAGEFAALLESKRAVKLPGVLTLKAITRPPRKGRNPATGASILVAERQALKTTATKALKDFLNKAD